MIRMIDAAEFVPNKNQTFLTTDVDEIINAVRLNGDKALKELSQKFDRVRQEEIMLSSSTIKKAEAKLDAKLTKAIFFAKTRIESYARLQMPRPFMKEVDGLFLGQVIRPIDCVGVYVPAGRYPLVSSVLMGMIPAKVAGCKKIIVCTPPKDNEIGADPSIVAAASILGADMVIALGGAQAIAAMALGTESVPKVDKVIGPGNRYVAAAKQRLSGIVGIDMSAGPSEIAILADDTSDPKYIAADMLAQAEHDLDAFAILFTSDPKLGRNVMGEVAVQIEKLPYPNRQVAKDSIRKNGLIVVGDMNLLIQKVNDLAPEHLEIQTDKVDLSQIRSAGSIFLGSMSCEAAGDYCTGPNHTLPTAGMARTRGALSVLDFIKIIPVQKLISDSYTSISLAATTLARAEGMEAHARSIEIRRKEK